MIQMMTAYTEEVDEVDSALDEIFGHIDLGKLKKHSVGLITCHFDFTEAGFIKALCERLPFEVIGMTTMASANQHGFSKYALSLTVLTSDEVLFQTAVTGSLNSDNYQQEITAAYAGAVKNLPGVPAMVIAFFPCLKTLAGQLMVRALDAACADVPIWGSLATNLQVSNENFYAFRNSDLEQNTMAILLIHGPVDPEFVVVSIPQQKIRDSRGVITDSDGCVLKKVNGISARQYFENLGVMLLKNASIVTPLMVYYEGSSEPVALGVYTIDDDGNLICGGETPTGATIAVGEISLDGIIATTREGVGRLMGSGRTDGLLMLPCVTRYVMLAPDQDSEMKLVANMVGDTVPFMLGYSGGEVCPVKDGAGRWQNRFHNYTFSACAF
jgi:hypothetical protein